MLGSHPSEPMIDKRRLTDASPRNDCYDVDSLLCPRTIQKSDILLSTKNLTSCNGQSGYRNFLGSQYILRLASYSSRIPRERLLQALTSDSTTRIDSACYRRHRLQQLVRSPETLCRIFLKEFFKKNYDWLWNIFELFKR
jgi:hypothetical protein